MKDGIYRGEQGVTYFILNNKILLKHFNTVYKTTKHFVFGEWTYPLTNEMKVEFNNVYNKVDKW